MSEIIHVHIHVKKNTLSRELIHYVSFQSLVDNEQSQESKWNEYLQLLT